VCVLVDLVKVQLVKVAHAGEHDAVAEFADIVEVLLEDWRVDLFRRRVGLEFWESWKYALDQVIEFDVRLSFGSAYEAD